MYIELFPLFQTLGEACAAINMMGIWEPTDCSYHLPYICESEMRGKCFVLSLFNPYHTEFLKWNNPPYILALSIIVLGISR